MARMLKVLCPKADRAAVVHEGTVIESYDAFVLLEAEPEAAQRLARRYPVEDITDQYTIQLHGRAIDASRWGGPMAENRRRSASDTSTNRRAAGPHHYLVQFIGPLKGSWLAGVRRAGGEVRAPYSNLTYVVRLDRTGLARVASLPYVRWVGHLPHEHRVARSLTNGNGMLPAAEGYGAVVDPLPRRQALSGLYTVEFFGSQDLERGLTQVQRLGFRVVDKSPKGSVLVVAAEGSRGRQRKSIKELSAVHGVRFIRERSLRRTTNDVAAEIMGTTAALGDPGLRLGGRGETVGICDTGLDTGDRAVLHPDFAKRVAFIKSYPIGPEFTRFIDNPGGDDGPADVDSGHGTHVAGSAVGDGTSSLGLAGQAGPVRGLAHRARLVFQAVEQRLEWKDPTHAQKYGRYLLAGIPLDTTVLFRDAYQRKVRVHSNSWGGGDPGAYDEQCSQLDRFVWEHPDFCVVVAAGNDGTDKDADGRINPMSVASPATAKNCVTVGACESRRPAFSAERYGDWWNTDYPVPPFRGDSIADNPDQVAAFSSRGPTLDGRVKPDVVAPGTYILSTRSTQIAKNNKAWAAFPPSPLYFHMGGTSMATPLVAGAAAVIREFLRRDRKIGRPTAALVKAVLVAGAKRLPGGPAGSVLDNDQGYGRVHIDGVLAPEAPLRARFQQVTPGLRTGEQRSIVVELASGASLRVVLAYSDFPGPALVNNLNLLITSPDGQTFVGNQPTGGLLTLDTVNNVEVVHLPSAAAGRWRISVMGSNVPEGPQPYALVVLASLS